jgi:hypothetical protein
MKTPDLIVIEGRAYSWKAILAARRAQLEQWKASQPAQPTLFALKEDCRPPAERSADGRYREPTLLAFLQDAGG